MSLGPLMIGIDGLRLSPRERDWLLNPLVCGVILFTRNFADQSQLGELVSEIREIRHPELLVAVDHEGGRVQRFKGAFTHLPALRLLGHLFDTDRDAAVRASRELGWLMAAELRAFAIDISFAPVVDLDLGLASVIGDRALHHDPEAAAQLAVAYMRGMQDAGMAATAKHFPSHAGAVIDSHLERATDLRDLPDLYDDLRPYQRLIDAGLHAVMMAHVVFPLLDELPASFSRWWIEEKLRGELRFSGVVISDDLGMGGVSAWGDMPQRAEMALEAGCDMLLLCNEPGSVEAVMRRLEGYRNPTAQLRLLRLRGRQAGSWMALTSGTRWAEAGQLVRTLSQSPEFTLDG